MRIPDTRKNKIGIRFVRRGTGSKIILVSKFLAKKKRKKSKKEKRRIRKRYEALKNIRK